MSPEIDTTIPGRLRHVLSAVRTALKTGDYSKLGALAREQEILISALFSETSQQTGAVRDHLGPLLRSAERNQHLLRAAIGGVKSAISRRKEVQEAASTTSIYDRSGNRSRLEPRSRAVEKLR